MRAATIRDGAISVQEHPDPEPQAGELLVRVRAAGINGADMLQLAGRYPAPPGAPRTSPGSSWPARWSRSARGVERFEPGDRVMAVVAGGGQAELAVVNERVGDAGARRARLDRRRRRARGLHTAHDALFTQAGLMVGERLLVHGAAGGVGMAAVQLGTMAGARVTATVRDEHCREQVAALGVNAIAPDEFADDGPVRRDPRARRRAEPPRQPRGARRCAGGSCVIGVGAGAQHRARPAHADGQARAHPRLDAARPLAGGEGRRRAARREGRAPGLRLRATSRVPVAGDLPLDDVADAYERFQAGGKLGKIVLELA